MTDRAVNYVRYLIELLWGSLVNFFITSSISLFFVLCFLYKTLIMKIKLHFNPQMLEEFFFHLTIKSPSFVFTLTTHCFGLCLDVEYELGFERYACTKANSQTKTDHSKGKKLKML